MVATPLERAGRRGWLDAARGIDQAYLAWAVTACAFVLCAVAVPGFFGARNLQDALLSQIPLGMLSLAIAVVIIGGGIDLSLLVNAVVSAEAVLVLSGQGATLWLALLGGAALALGIGAMNGLFIAYGELPPLIVTIASGLLVFGICRQTFFTEQSTVVPDSARGLVTALNGRVLGLPTPILILVVLALLVFLFLTRTRQGRFLYAMGDNVRAARLSGIAVRPITVVTYTVAGLFAFLTGLVMCAQGGALGSDQAQSSMLYDVITVAVIGGVSLAGGRGRVSGVLGGVALIAVLLNALTLLNLSESEKVLVKGSVLIVALVADAVLHPRVLEQIKAGDL